MTTRMPIVHIPVREAGSGSGAGWWEMQAVAWEAKGYAVRPIPNDGRTHPTGKECPICS